MKSTTSAPVRVTALVTALLLPGLRARTGGFEEHRDYRVRREMDGHDERHDEHHEGH